MLNPILVINPPEDDVFAAFAKVVVDDGVSSTGELERRLRPIYSKAVVHARELSSEPFVIWYVYRDGHWVSARATVRRSAEPANDVQVKR